MIQRAHALATFDMSNTITGPESPTVMRLACSSRPAALAEALTQIVGVAPGPGCAAFGERQVRVIWRSLGVWLLVGEAAPILGAEAAKTAHCAAIPLTGGLSMWRIAGGHWRETLAHGCPLDVEHPSFTTGSAAATLFRGLDVLIDVVALDECRLYTPRSYAVDFDRELRSASHYARSSL